MNTSPRNPIADKNAPDNDELAPEAHNLSQYDEGEQAQTLADEARGRGSDFGEGDTEKPDHDGISDSDGDSTPDLVDTMNQMVSSGHIDMGAFRGERNDDDEEEGLGEQGLEDEGPRGAK
jgi:hypothetical protein